MNWIATGEQLLESSLPLGATQRLEGLRTVHLEVVVCLVVAVYGVHLDAEAIVAGLGLHLLVTVALVTITRC